MKNPEINPHSFKEKETAVINKIAEKRESVFSRFPLLFTLLATFGVVATFYGFEGLINKVNPLAENPVIVLATGLMVLILTGALYKKLG